MKERDPSPNVSEARSMNEAETRAFLSENGVQPLDLDRWRPRQPILCVFNDRMRKVHDFDGFTPDKNPGIVRVDDPVGLNFNDPKVYVLRNGGGRIDYYAIDPKTKKVTLVKSSHNSREYLVLGGALFMPADHLFPKGK